MGRIRARDFDFTIRRRVHVDVDRTVKRRRVDLAPTVKRAIDVEKAFAFDAATERVEASRVAPDAADDAPDFDVDLSELQAPDPVRAGAVMSRASRVRPRALLAPSPDPVPEEKMRVRVGPRVPGARKLRTLRPFDAMSILRWVVLGPTLLVLVACLVALLRAWVTL